MSSSQLKFLAAADAHGSDQAGLSLDMIAKMLAASRSGELSGPLSFETKRSEIARSLVANSLMASSSEALRAANAARKNCSDNYFPCAGKPVSVRLSGQARNSLLANSEN